MRVSILIMAFLPPFRALTSASSARVAASLHWASSSFLSFSRFMASSCSQRSSSARRAASTMARAALSSDILASLVISSRSALSWPSSPSSFLFDAVMDWLVLVRSARVNRPQQELIVFDGMHITVLNCFAHFVRLVSNLYPSLSIVLAFYCTPLIFSSKKWGTHEIFLGFFKGAESPPFSLRKFCGSVPSQTRRILLFQLC